MRLRRMLILVLAAALLAALPRAGEARRVALVVGNGDYRHAAPLPNPINDATALAATLEEMGFEVVTGIDLDREATLATLKRFAGLLDGAEVGLFFYAGHGMQVNGINYLVPVDAELSREADVFLSLVSLDQILQIMETEVPTRLVLLDACRDNPLARTLARSMGATRSTAVGQGLARIDTAVGTLIAYATAPGDVAEDGQGRHSPFTAALLEHIDTPGLEARQVLSRVRQSVHAETDGRQVPWDSSSLMGDFYFNLDIDVTVEAPPAPSAEVLFWDTIKASEDPADYRAYLDRFGADGVFADLAGRRLAALTPTEAPAEAPPATAPPATPALDQAGWRQLQAALLERGFDPGGVDGRPGPNTFRALDAWKRSAGVAAAAPVDVALLNRLLGTPPPRTEPQPEPAPQPTERTARQPGEVIRDCDTCPEMVVVPAGSFRMGSAPGEPGHEADEGPPIEVTIAEPFAIGRHEVTRGQYRAFVEATGHRTQEGCLVWLVVVSLDRNKSWQDNVSGTADDLPVACVSVEDALAYADWLSAESGATYRLPSEAEFYWAASGGAATAYAWGDRLEDACAHANVYDRSGRAAMPLSPWRSLDCDDGHAHLAPVGSYRANGFGLHDTTGNASEYVGDCYVATLDGLPADGSYRRSGGDCNRVPLKGGSNWAAADLATPLADRWVADRRNGGFEWTGFRLVRELD